MASTEGDLPRRFTLLDTVALCIGGMIGSGIYLKPAAIAVLLPSPPLIIGVWVAAGILTLLGSLTFADLGARQPRHGGLYVFITEAFGRPAGFLFGWSLLAVLETGSIAGLAAGVVQLAGRQFPVSPGAVWPLEAGLIILLSLVNMVSVKGGAWVQNIFTGAKTLGLVLLILGGLWVHPSPTHLQDVGVLPGGFALLSAFGACMVKALWAYDGWINVTFVAGEVQDPMRTLPRALGLGTAVVVLVYVSANVTYHTVLPLTQIQTSPSVGGDVAMVLFGGAAAAGMVVLMMASAFGTLNSSILTGARVYFAMARDNLLPRWIGWVLPGARSPAASLALQAAWAIGLLTMWKQFDRITDNVVFIYWIFYALGALSVLVKPTEGRRMWGFPYVPILFIAVSICLTVNSIITNPHDAIQAGILLAVGGLLYPFVRRRQASVSIT